MNVMVHCEVNPEIKVKKLHSNNVGDFFSLQIKPLNEHADVTIFLDTLAQVKALANDILKECEKYE